MAELYIAFLIDRFGIFEETLVTGDIGRVELRDFAKLGGSSRFIEEGFQRDFTGARLTLRLKGDVDFQGSSLLLLAQARVGDICINSVLQAQPFAVSNEWTEQTVTLEEDDNQWKCLGARHDVTDQYGCSNIGHVLRDLNCDIILILHPLDVAAVEPFDGDIHLQRAEKEYDVDRTRLPTGYVLLDEGSDRIRQLARGETYD